METKCAKIHPDCAVRRAVYPIKIYFHSAYHCHLHPFIVDLQTKNNLNRELTRNL